MKITNKLTVALVALSLCVVMAAPVAALSSTIVAGIYGTLNGTFTATDVSSGLETLTWIKKNPDSAYLVTTVEFSNGVYFMGEMEEQSDRAATRFSSTFRVPNVNGYPNYVYTCHEVRGGTTSPEAYATRCEGSVDFN